MILLIEVAMGIIQEVTKGMESQIITITEGETLEVKITIGIEVGHTKDRAEIEGTIETLATVDQVQVQVVTTNRDRIRCFKCREYDHFARDCPTRQASRKVEQM